MRSTLIAIVVASLVASPLHAAAQAPLRATVNGSGAGGVGASVPTPPTPGPLERSISREAARLAASGQSPAAPSQAGGAGAPVQMKWSELGGIIVGQRVAVTLSDGRVVRGEALAVRDTELLLDANGDSKGSATVPRESVVSLTVSRLRGSGGRIFGGVVGVVGGMWLSGYAASTTDSPGVGWTVFLTGTTALGMIGYQAGKKFDTRTTRIVVVP